MSQAIVTWYGHSCFRIELAGSSLVIDPYSAGYVPGLHLPQLTADAALSSHDHSDHNGVERVILTGRPLCCSVRTVSGVHDHHGGAHRGENLIHIFEAEGLRLVHMGDQGCALTPEQAEEIGRPDLLLLPVGGHYTIDAREAHDMMRLLRPRVTVPMHYREGVVGYRVLSTLEPFLETEMPVIRAESNCVTIEPEMPEQILIPKLVR